jgi:hypothetical protein
VWNRWRVEPTRQKFSKGAGSSDLIADRAGEFSSEEKRLRKQWDYTLKNKEALYYYKVIRERYDDPFLFNTMGHSRSL